jgi:hypothetical protein
MRPSVNAILEIIDELYGNTSVPDTKTLSWLQEIKSNVDGKIESLQEQIKNREDGKKR